MRTLGPVLFRILNLGLPALLRCFPALLSARALPGTAFTHVLQCFEQCRSCLGRGVCAGPGCCCLLWVLGLREILGNNS